MRLGYGVISEEHSNRRQDRMDFGRFITSPRVDKPILPNPNDGLDSTFAMRLCFRLPALNESDYSASHTKRQMQFDMAPS